MRGFSPQKIQEDTEKEVANVYSLSLGSIDGNTFCSKIGKKKHKFQKKCLSEIKTPTDLKSVIPGDIHDLDSSIMVELFQRSLALH